MVTAEESRSLEYTPTWVVAVVCSAIVLISFGAASALHQLGKFLKHKHQDALFEALQKLKEELMLLGFISLLLTVFQSLISHICIPIHLASYMLPCEMESVSSSHERYTHQTMMNVRKLLAEGTTSKNCANKGKVPLLSLEALHQLHIFIFVLAVVHAIFCATTMVLGGAKIRQWKYWEDSVRKELSGPQKAPAPDAEHQQIFSKRAGRYWRRSAVVSWLISCFKQFYGSVTESDYISLRSGFIRAHCPSNPNFDFHKYMLRTLEVDFKKIVGISWYLWLFVVIFLLLNIEGWHTYFWLSYLPLVLLLLVGAKLEHIIMRLAEEAVEKMRGTHEVPVKPSDELFWFHRPAIVLYLIHFILFQNAFEIAFFFWIWSTYGFNSCIMEGLGYIIPRLFIGVLVQVLCSYSTLPLYALVTQMGSMFKQGIFDEFIHGLVLDWARGNKTGLSNTNRSEMNRMEFKESFESICVAELPMVAEAGCSSSIVELSSPKQTQTSCS